MSAITVTLEQLQEAFDKAEQRTAEHYNGQTCGMVDSLGNNSCPICYFRVWVKHHLGISNYKGESIYAHKREGGEGVNRSETSLV